jgi:hypothetical protein
MRVKGLVGDSYGAERPRELTKIYSGENFDLPILGNQKSGAGGDRRSVEYILPLSPAGQQSIRKDLWRVKTFC